MYTKKSEAKAADMALCQTRWPELQSHSENNKNHQQPEMVHQHCHPADEAGIQVQEMKQKTASTMDKPNQNFTFTNAKVPYKSSFTKCWYM